MKLDGKFNAGGSWVESGLSVTLYLCFVVSTDSDLCRPWKYIIRYSNYCTPKGYEIYYVLQRNMQEDMPGGRGTVWPHAFKRRKCNIHLILDGDPREFQLALVMVELSVVWHNENKTSQNELDLNCMSWARFVHILSPVTWKCKRTMAAARALRRSLDRVIFCFCPTGLDMMKRQVYMDD